MFEREKREKGYLLAPPYVKSPKMRINYTPSKNVKAIKNMRFFVPRKNDIYFFLRKRKKTETFFEWIFSIEVGKNRNHNET